jgi:hypothetical protein
MVGNNRKEQMNVRILPLLLAVLISARSPAQLIDGCESLNGWSAVPTHDSTVTLSTDQGKTGRVVIHYGRPND